jgi:DNA-binding transcriptional LysR family regulator
MDTLACMRAFLAVASERSFTAGAQRLGLSTRQASTYVQQLESQLGTRLFNRTTRSVALTESGDALLPRCRRWLEDYDELVGELQTRSGRLAGPIRLSAPTGFGSLRLAPALHGFLVAHPDIRIDLDLSDRRVSLVEEGYDLAVRLGTLEDSTLVARRVAELRIVVCAAPDYLARHGRPAHPQELAQHHCLINTGLIDGHHWPFQAHGRAFEVRVQGRFHANAPGAVAQLAARGLGVVQCPHYTVEALLREGALCLLLEPFERRDSGVFAVYPPNRHLPARVRALVDFLQAAWA